MPTQNLVFLVIKSLLYDTVKDIVRFPIWWYTKGLVRTWKRYVQTVQNAERRIGLLVWIKNIGKPMFGQYDITGRIISFIVRILQIIVRFFVLIIWISVLTLRLLIWAVLPFVVASQILFQVSGGFVGQL